MHYTLRLTRRGRLWIIFCQGFFWFVMLLLAWYGAMRLWCGAWTR